MPVVLRQQTQPCPPPVVEIDRSFSAPAPACVASIAQFWFEEGGVWATQAPQAIEGIVTAETCIAAVQDWIETEKENRGLNDE